LLEHELEVRECAMSMAQGIKEQLDHTSLSVGNRQVDRVMSDSTSVLAVLQADVT